jgi:hypothetical protein
MNVAGRDRKPFCPWAGWTFLEKQYDDPIAHFKEVARKMTEEEQANNKVTLQLDMK